MDFFRSITGREGCFDSQLSDELENRRLDICFQFHDAWGIEKSSTAAVSGGNTNTNHHFQTVAAMLNVSESSSSQSHGQNPAQSPQGQRQYGVIPSETCIIKQVGLEATITVQIYITSVGDILTASNSEKRFAGEVRIPIHSLLKPQIGEMLYYSWLQLDTSSLLANSVSNSLNNSITTDEMRFEQALYSGPRNIEAPKICVTVCKYEDLGSLPFSVNDRDLEFRARNWVPLLQSHIQHATLTHTLNSKMNNYMQQYQNQMMIMNGNCFNKGSNGSGPGHHNNDNSVALVSTRANSKESSKTSNTNNSCSVNTCNSSSESQQLSSNLPNLAAVGLTNRNTFLGGSNSGHYGKAKLRRQVREANQRRREEEIGLEREQQLLDPQLKNRSKDGCGGTNGNAGGSEDDGLSNDSDSNGNSNSNSPIEDNNSYNHSQDLPSMSVSVHNNNNWNTNYNQHQNQNLNLSGHHQIIPQFGLNNSYDENSNTLFESSQATTVAQRSSYASYQGTNQNPNNTHVQNQSQDSARQRKKLILLESLVTEQKLELEKLSLKITEKTVENKSLQEKVDEKVHLHRTISEKAAVIEQEKEQILAEKELESSSNQGMINGMKKRHETEVCEMKKELTKLEEKLAKKDTDLKELLRKSNKKIDDGNATILKLKGERDSLVRKNDEREVEVNTLKIKMEQKEASLLEREKERVKDLEKIQILEAKNKELMKIVTDLYDSSDNNSTNVVLDRQSLDAFTRKWS